MYDRIRFHCEKVFVNDRLDERKLMARVDWARERVII